LKECRMTTGDVAFITSVFGLARLLVKTFREEVLPFLKKSLVIVVIVIVLT